MASACEPYQACTVKNSSENVEHEEGDLHGLISFRVSKSVMSQDLSNMHSWVGALCNEHAHHDVVGGHVICQWITHSKDAYPMMNSHCAIQQSIVSHGKEVIEEIPNSTVDHVFIILCVFISARSWHEIVGIDRPKEQD